MVVLGCPEFEPAVVANWTAALHAAEAHSVRPHKVRAFLFAKGGINRAAAAYRASRANQADRDDERIRDRFRDPPQGRRMPHGMNTLYD
jgi:hypothetical protein